MRRDPQLMMLILLQVRDEKPPVELQQYPEAEVVYNSALLVKDDYVDGSIIEDSMGNYASVVMLHLTNKGHDLLEKLESESHSSQRVTTPQGSTGDPVAIFISHSARDEPIAKALVELLRAALNTPANSIRCTSVNGYRLPAGAPIDEQLRLEVHESAAFIGLITPSSMASTYVLFELGARWGAGRHLVPLLAGGANSGLLRGPLSTLNALTCDDAGQVHQLVDDLVKHLSISGKTAPAGYQAHIEALMKASKGGAAGHPVESTPPEQVERALTDEELRVMKLYVDARKEGLLEETLCEKLGLHRLKVGQLLEQLTKREFLYHAVRMGLPGRYRLAAKGRNYLVDNNLL